MWKFANDTCLLATFNCIYYFLPSDQRYNQVNLFQLFLDKRICITMIMVVLHQELFCCGFYLVLFHVGVKFQMENTDYIAHEISSHSLYKEMKSIQIKSSSLPLF